jgi:hypothetical protein
METTIATLRRSLKIHHRLPPVLGVARGGLRDRVPPWTLRVYAVCIWLFSRIHFPTSKINRERLEGEWRAMVGSRIFRLHLFISFYHSLLDAAYLHSSFYWREGVNICSVCFLADIYSGFCGFLSRTALRHAWCYLAYPLHQCGILWIRKINDEGHALTVHVSLWTSGQ